MITPAAVAERLALVRQRIEGAGSDGITIVAVTKGFGVDAMEAALANGLVDIGENYAQELLAKRAALRSSIAPRMHFIGRLQSNKVRRLAPVVDVWQTVDRSSLGVEIARRAPGARVLVQVNVSDEDQKGGCAPERAAPLVKELTSEGLAVEGLMAIGRTGDPEDARPGFRLARKLADDLGLAVCSMGMTDDLEVAVEEGSTMVRLGSALFGLRPDSGARAQ